MHGLGFGAQAEMQESLTRQGPWRRTGVPRGVAGPPTTRVLVLGCGATNHSHPRGHFLGTVHGIDRSCTCTCTPRTGRVWPRGQRTCVRKRVSLTVRGLHELRCAASTRARHVGASAHGACQSHQADVACPASCSRALRGSSRARSHRVHREKKRVVTQVPTPRSPAGTRPRASVATNRP